MAVPEQVEPAHAPRVETPITPAPVAPTPVTPTPQTGPEGRGVTRVAVGERRETPRGHPESPPTRTGTLTRPPVSVEVTEEEGPTLAGVEVRPAPVVDPPASRRPT